MKFVVTQLIVFLFASVLFAQVFEDKCNTMEYLNQQLEQDPGLMSRMIVQENQIQEWIVANYNPNDIQSITIPVVVHIVYHTDEENISDLRVYEQIEMTNRNFAGLNTNPMWAFPDSLKANTGIQFCLAQRKPDGTATNGIERRYTQDTIFRGNYVKSTKNGGLDAWDPSKYFNIWVCRFGNGLGYAQFPFSGINATYGAVINYIAFGKTDAVSYRNNGGVTTHEIGHCFYLYHVWGDDQGACTGTDYCDDTPNQADHTYGNPTGMITDSCTSTSPGILYMNFMNYTYDSTVTCFTPDQTARMQAMFVLPYGPLFSLTQSDACSPPVSVINSIHIENFSISPNPASDLVTLNYSLSDPIAISFRILNSMGQEVLEIPNNQVNEYGDHSLNFDVGSLAQGVYYCIIHTANEFESKKFLIVR